MSQAARATKGERFAGLTVALVTPFRGSEIDWANLNQLVDWHVEQGTDCLAPVGTTGESPTLDHDEHERVIAAVCERARGRIKVMPRNWRALLFRSKVKPSAISRSLKFEVLPGLPPSMVAKSLHERYSALLVATRYLLAFSQVHSSSSQWLNKS